MIYPGTVASWLTLAVLVYGLVVFRRGGGGAALSELETANRVLEKQLTAAKHELLADRLQIETLQASRDFAAAIAPLMAQVREHEATEERQFAQMIGVLEQIAGKLGVYESVAQ
jgi:hypothetical protein